MPRTARRPTVPPIGAAELRRPALLPGLVRLRRNATSVQLGVEPPHAVVLQGLAAGHHTLLGSLDGSLDQDELRRLAVRVGLSSADVPELLGLLAARGLLHEGDEGAATAPQSADERARLAPDLVSLALRHATDGPAWSVFQHRTSSWVDVRGAGRVGSAIATLLGAAGVGRVSVADPTVAAPADQTPAGLGRLPVGGSRELATRERIRSVAESVRVARPAAPAKPDLVVLAPDAGPGSTLVATWSRRSTSHLLAFVRETTGVVGPLVIPGQTGCLACLELHRRDRDPGWPIVAAQLARAVPDGACDVALATLVAAQATMQALAYVDGSETAVRDATLETSLQSGITRRRSWSPHPTCGCRWATVADHVADDSSR